MRWERIFGFKAAPGSLGKYVSKPSPDLKFRLVFEPGDEVSMMRYVYQFRLIDAKDTVVQAFKGLASPVQTAWWTPDSRIVAVPLLEKSDCLLLFNVKNREHAVIHFSVYQSDAAFTSRSVRIGVNLREFKATFGDDFEPPGDTVFPFASLDWRPAPGRH